MLSDSVIKIIVYIGLTIVVFILGEKYTQSHRKRKGDPNMYLKLRETALNMNPEFLGLKEHHQRNPFGVIMDYGLERGTVTVVAFIDGNASIYFSSGGGVIGGYAHERVVEVAVRLVTTASTYISKMISVRDFLPPINGNVVFYALTDKGSYTMTAKETELKNKQHEFWPIYYLCHDVITELRLLTGNK